MSVQFHVGDCRSVLSTLEAGSVHTCVTSPPYFGLRDYGHAGQIGLEDTPDAFVAEMVAVFREVRRVLRDDGTLWLNLGDSYSSTSVTQSTPKARGGRFGEAGGSGRREVQTEAITVRRPDGWTTGLKQKDLIGIPWRVAFALQADGWYLRQEIIWHKLNPMPESVRDRCTKAHEHVFLLTKRPTYYFDAEGIKEKGVIPAGTLGGKGSAKRAAEPGVNSRPPEYKVYDGQRNKRSVWSLVSEPYPDAHFATYPPALIEPCILAGCPEGGTVLDPFGGAGTTGLVADRLQRNAVLIELNPEYAAIARRRLEGDAGLFAEVA